MRPILLALVLVAVACADPYVANCERMSTCGALDGATVEDCTKQRGDFSVRMRAKHKDACDALADAADALEACAAALDCAHRSPPDITRQCKAESESLASQLRSEACR